MYKNTGNSPGARKFLGIFLIIVMLVMAWLILRGNGVFGQEERQLYTPIISLADNLQKDRDRWFYFDTIDSTQVDTLESVFPCKEIVDSVWICPRHGVIERHTKHVDPDCRDLGTDWRVSSVVYFIGRPFCLQCWQENLPIEEVFANQVRYVAAEDSNKVLVDSSGYKDGYCPTCGTQGKPWDERMKTIKQENLYGGFSYGSGPLGVMDPRWRKTILYRKQYFCPKCGSVFVGLKEIEKTIEY